MLKRFLVIAAKNAVNAALLSLAVVYHNPTQYNYTSVLGLWNIGKFILLPAVAIREGMIWVPLLLKWSSTGANIDGANGAPPPAPPAPKG
jgi:hypothetical protein